MIKSKTLKPLNLYWVETEDHGEDWFVVARSALSACRIHEDDEGYARGDADAELVCALPASLKDVEAGWPSDGVLDACGAERLTGTGGDGNPRTVRINGRVFGEGDVFVLAAARAGHCIAAAPGRIDTGARDHCFGGNMTRITRRAPKPAGTFA